jgi:lipopolysaccharide transport system permease protein
MPEVAESPTNRHQAPSSGPHALLDALWRHRVLTAQLTRRDIAARYKGSALGILWSFAQPVLMLAVYTFVFGVVFRGSWPGGTGSTAEFALVLFAGLLVFQLFADTVSAAPTLILGNVNYVKKVIFPLEILPVSKFGGALFHLATSAVVWLVFHLTLLGPPPATSLLLPVVLAPLMLTTLGVAWFLAALGVYLRDTAQVIGVALSVLMFATPIFYPASAVPEPYRAAIRWLPLTHAVESARDVLVWGRLPDAGAWIAQAAIAAAIALLGFAWFQKVRQGFADVL